MNRLVAQKGGLIWKMVGGDEGAVKGRRRRRRRRGEKGRAIMTKRCPCYCLPWYCLPWYCLPWYCLPWYCLPWY